MQFYPWILSMQLFITDCVVSREVQLLLYIGPSGDLGNRVVRSSTKIDLLRGELNAGAAMD